MSAASPSSRTSARRAGTTLGVALALALAAPAAAFADPVDEPREDRRSEQGTAHAQDERGTSAPAEDEPAAGKPAEKKPTRSGSSQGDADPRGNNGTVKIDGEAFDDGRGNEPHVGCTFQVDFYGFDAGDTASITFTGHAPTGGGLLHSESRTISTDAAGGGQDRDATFTYSVDDQLSELRSIAPHAQQGWHVKLAVDVDSAPGGAKQKVFWIDCPAPAATLGGGTTTAQGGGTTTAQGGGTPTTALGGATTDAATAVVAQRSVRTSSLLSRTTVAAAERQDALTLGAGSATLASGAVSARGSSAPSTLPFTGTQGLVWLLATGLSALGVGALAHRLGRRRAAVTTG